MNRRPSPLRALAPRPGGPILDRARALETLDLDLPVVGAWCMHAIARAWDSRRIGYANDGRHPFEMEVAGIVGVGHGHAGDYVVAAREQVEALEPAYRARHAARPRTTLAMLAAELGLSPVAADALLVIAAPSLRGDLARLYGILANDRARPLCDEELVADILGVTGAARHDLARELDPDQPLRRLGLVREAAGAARPFAGLTVDPVVLARLRRRPLRDLDSAVRVLAGTRSLDELILPDGVGDFLAGLAAPAPAARVVVRGRPASGRRTLLAALAATARRRLAVIDVSLLPREPAAFAEALRRRLQRAVLAGHLPCVSELERAAGEESTADALREVVRAHPGPITFRLSPDTRPPLDPGYLQLDLPPLDEGARRGLWQRRLDDAGLRADAAALAGRYRCGPGVICRAVAHVGARGGRGADATPALETAVRQSLDDRLGQLATRVTRLAGWDAIILPDDVLDSLHELVGRVRHRRVVFEEWGFDEAITSARGLTALFQGGPGTGKSLVAGALARELGLDLYRVDLSRVVSKWLGESERNLSQLFDAAEEGHVMLLFDEADALFAKRTEVKSSNDRHANLAVNYLLQRLDAFEGIAILTTNFGGSIDAAFKRRLSFRLTFPFPDEEMRARLWRAHLPARLPVAGDLRVGAIAARYPLSGGYIRNAALRAAFLAARAATPLSHAHLERAVALEYQDVGKLSSSGLME